MSYFCLHFDVDDLYLRRRLLTMRSAMHTAGSRLESALRGPLASIIEAVRLGRGDEHRDRLATQNACLLVFAALGDWVLRDEAEQPRVAASDATANAVRLAAGIERLLQKAVQGGGLQRADAGAAADADAGERVSIERIAAELGYSPAYCNRVFQRIYGMSPRQYLTGLILREAKLLLSDPERTVEEIASLLGYRDVSQFSKQFKRWTNLSPLGYRRLSH